jgi:subtilisin family serine protease
MTARRSTGSLAVITLSAGLLVAPAVAGAASGHIAAAHSEIQAHAQRFGIRPRTVGSAHVIGSAPAAKIVGAGIRRRRAVFVQFAGSGAAAAFRTALRAASGPRTARNASAVHAALVRRAAVRQTARAVLATASAADPSTRKLWEVGNALPGMGLVTTPRGLRAIAARTDVAKISTLVPKRPANANTAALTRSLDTWADPGMTGAGVTVGVIDTGIDYTHADFGGVGTTDAYNTARADDTDPDWRAALPALAQAKIAGGFDLAGDSYDAGSSTNDVPSPDPNPLDCSGHGTHVAGTIGGYGVNGDGTTFSSDDYADLDKNDLLAMQVGPGMAPDAQLYPLKIFGCSGSSDLLIPALNRALDPNDDGNFSDHLDVVDIALTSDYATPDDPDNAEVNAVADAGVLPVVAIGNGGDITDAGGAPADATRALAVASSVDSYQLRDGLHVSTSPPGVVPNDIADGQDARSYTYPDGPVSGAVVTMPNDNGTPAHDNADGCNTFNASQSDAVSGKVVWLEWDDNAVTRRCDAHQRSANALAAGATGVVLTSTTSVFGGTLDAAPGLPVFQLGDSDTTALRSAAMSGGLAVTFDPALRNSVPTQTPSLTDTLSSFSARGPHGSQGVVKPDVTAPGDTIASAGMATGSGVSVESGTSMAAALVAGVAALVDQAHPGWSAEELKAAVMNTADHDIHVAGDDSAAYGPARVGAGRVDALDAVTTPLLAFNNDIAGGVSASFGVVTAPANVSSVGRSQTIKVENTGDTKETATVQYTPAVAEPGVQYSIQGLATGGTLNIPAHTSQLVTVTMTVRSSALRHTIDPTMTRQSALGDGLPAQNRQYVSDASGRLVITPKDTTLPPLRVPIYGAARPASTLTAEGGTDEILRSGTSFDQGPSTPDNTTWTSFAVPMGLDATSKQLPACTGSITVKCTANQTAQGGDIRYVGSSSFPGKSAGKPSLANGYFYIGISTYGDNATLGHAVQPYALIYLKGHPKPDFESYVADLPGTDILLNNVVDLETGRTVDQEFVNWEDGSVDTNVFDTNTVIMPIWLAALGVHDSTKTLPIKFTVGEASRYAVNADGNIDSVGPISVDAVHPAVSVGVTPGLVPLFDGNGPLPTDVTRPHTKALVFFLHNPDDRVGDTPDVDRDQVVSVSPRATTLSMHAPSSIKFGHAAAISGTLKRKNGTAIKKASVDLDARQSGQAGYKTVATATTDGHGAVATTVHPKKNTSYEWRWSGADGDSAVNSAARKVAVHQIVRIDAKPAGVARKKSFRLYGTTKPLVSGAHIRVQLRADGRWRTIRTVTTQEQQLPNGIFEAGYKFDRSQKSAGTYSFRAVWPAANGRAGGTSTTVRVTVH